MTVKELIEELQEYDEDDKVLCITEENGICELSTVEYIGHNCIFVE